MFKIWYWLIIFVLVKIFGVFFGGKIYKGYFYVLFFSGFVGKFVVFWWDLEFFIIILKLVKFFGFWKIDFLIVNYYDFF